MRRLLQLAGTLALTGAAAAHAQIVSPDVLVGHPPAPREHRGPAPEDNLQWLWSYTRDANSETALALRDDARFQQLLRTAFTAPQSFWDDGRPLLKDAIPIFLARYGHIESFSNRYVTVDGCVRRFCPAHGLLWFDLGTAHPTVIFVAVNWSTEGHTVDEAAAPYDLWAYSNKPFNAAAIPDGLTEAISAWQRRLAVAGRIVPHIRHATLVNPNHSLVLIRPELLGANQTPPQPAVSPADGAGADTDK